jgi:hypothetical protein
VFVSGKSFQTSVMFESKDRAYPTGAPLGYLPSPNITLGWKGLPRTNTLAYWDIRKLNRKKTFVHKAHSVDFTMKSLNKDICFTTLKLTTRVSPIF